MHMYPMIKCANPLVCLSAARGVVDNLAFSLESFEEEGLLDRPLLFYCVSAAAEDIALYLIKKGVDVRDCIAKDAAGNKLTIQDAAFKAQLGMLYQTLADMLGFKARRLSAFSETSSMKTDQGEHEIQLITPTRPVHNFKQNMSNVHLHTE